MNDELHDKDNDQRGPIDTELQVRLMNLVLGEASDFERDQLQLLMEQRPELAAFEKHLLHLHGLLCEVGSGELNVDAAAASDEGWQLPADKRNQLLAVIDGETARASSLVASSTTTKGKKPKPRWFAAVLALGTAACLLAGLMLPAVQSARESARRAQVLARNEHSGFAASLPAPYYMNDDVQYMEDNSGSMSSRVMPGKVMAGRVPSSTGPAAPAASETDKVSGAKGFGWARADSNGDRLADSNYVDLQDRIDLPADSVTRAVDLSRLYAGQPAGQQGVPPTEDRTTVRKDIALEMPKSEPEFWYDSSKTSKGVSLGVEVPQLARPVDEKAYTVQVPEEGTIMLGGIERSASGGRFGDQAAKADSDADSALVTPRLRTTEEEPGIAGTDAAYGSFGIERGRQMERAPMDADDWKKVADDNFEASKEQSSQVQKGKDRLSGDKSGKELEQLDRVSKAQGQVQAGKSLQTEEKQVDEILAKQESDVKVLESVAQHDARLKTKQNLSEASAAKDGEAWDVNSPSNGTAPAKKHWRTIPAPSPEVIAAKERVSEYEAKPADVDYFAKSAAAKSAAAKPGATQAAAIDEQSAAKEAFSTFSLHVSDVSFKLAQTALAQGQWPEAAKIRIEEFVNAMNYHDPLPAINERVACRVEQAIHPFLMQRNLLRISMRTSATGRSQNTPLRLTLVLDNSGSMERPDRRQAVLRAFEALIAQLKPTDQVTLISFANQPRLLADKVAGNQGQSLLQLIETLPSEGGTNIEAALMLAREKAVEQKLAGAKNRIVLFTDGAVNLGDADPDSLSKLVTQLRDSGIAFDAAGISAVDLNDEVLEALTRKGDGRYYLLDSVEEVSQGFAAQIAGALRPSAQNVKVQVEFNPDRVGRYKLLGFEKHRLNKEDFRNDQVDAAELAAAEAGVALYQYEIKPNGSGDIGNVSVRFRDLSSGQMVERRWPISYETSTPRLEQAQASMRVAAAAAFFAAKLSGGPLADSVDLVQLQKLVTGLPDEFAQQPRVVQLRTMIEQAQGLNK